MSTARWSAIQRSNGQAMCVHSYMSVEFLTVASDRIWYLSHDRIVRPTCNDGFGTIISLTLRPEKSYHRQKAEWKKPANTNRPSDRSAANLITTTRSARVAYTYTTPQLFPKQSTTSNRQNALPHPIHQRPRPNPQHAPLPHPPLRPHPNILTALEPLQDYQRQHSNFIPPGSKITW